MRRLDTPRIAVERRLFDHDKTDYPWMIMHVCNCPLNLTRDEPTNFSDSPCFSWFPVKFWILQKNIKNTCNTHIQDTDIATSYHWKWWESQGDDYPKRYDFQFGEVLWFILIEKTSDQEYNRITRSKFSVLSTGTWFDSRFHMVFVSGFFI